MITMQNAKKAKEDHDLGTRVMAHRYLYYVLADPVLTDFAYDALERLARESLPATSPVHGIGSSLPRSYTAEQVSCAMLMLDER